MKFYLKCWGHENETCPHQTEGVLRFVQQFALSATLWYRCAFCHLLKPFSCSVVASSRDENELKVFRPFKCFSFMIFSGFDLTIWSLQIRSTMKFSIRTMSLHFRKLRTNPLPLRIRHTCSHTRCQLLVYAISFHVDLLGSYPAVLCRTVYGLGLRSENDQDIFVLQTPTFADFVLLL